MRVCSLFAGAGGIDLAFEQAGVTTVWANEFDKDACKTFRKNFPGIPLVDDYRRTREINLKWDEVNNMIRDYLKSIEVLP